MLSKLKEFFLNEMQASDDSGADEHKRQLACAALLLEVAIIDQEFDASELAMLRQVLTDKFGLSHEECDTLISLAQSEYEDATSTYQFTQLVNEYCGEQEKYRLVKGMWQIAYADGQLDKYEEYVIRKISELIYLSHSSFIKAKLEARTDA